LPPALAGGCKNENRYLGFSQRNKKILTSGTQRKRRKIMKMFVKTHTMAAGTDPERIKIFYLPRVRNATRG
jgi:hypothetical protein